MDEFPFDDDDVISIDPQYTSSPSSLLKMGWIKSFVGRGFGSSANQWLGEGIPCEVLKAGSNWKKGRLRIRLEFVPDEPPSRPGDEVS